MQTVKKHKDRLFRFILGNPEHKEWTLSLYNALNDSHYTNPEDIEFNTIEDVIYMGMKNDVSFLVTDAMNPGSISRHSILTCLRVSSFTQGSFTTST